MIISNIMGGLGNQMFQYAMGRALSLKLETDYYVDVSDFSRHRIHQGFELDRIFNISCAIARDVDVRRLLGWRQSALLRRIFNKLPVRLSNSTFIREPHFQYWHGSQDLPRDCYLSGYWQSAKYFEAFESTIRNDFAFMSPLSEMNSVVAEAIYLSNAISLHVRRGDYTSKNSSAKHGLCSPSYYETAMEYMLQHTPKPHFFVFSDDVEWVKENISFDFPHTFVTHNTGANSFNDMRLMSMCQSHITANSSFSWWGAWLNPRKTKIVVSPKAWFADNTVSDDLIPPNWMRL